MLLGETEQRHLLPFPKDVQEVQFGAVEFEAQSAALHAAACQAGLPAQPWVAVELCYHLPGTHQPAPHLPGLEASGQVKASVTCPLAKAPNANASLTSVSR